MGDLTLRPIKSEVLDLISSDLVFSDLLIEEGEPIVLKTPAGWRRTSNEEPVLREEIISLVQPLSPDCTSAIARGQAVKIKMLMSGCRLRCLLYSKDGQRRLALTIRRQTLEPMSLEETGLPKYLERLCESSRGLILLTGPTGSGKSTAAMAFLDAINAQRPVHIATVEDPIEYELRRKRAVITQQEVGDPSEHADVVSFSEGLRRIMRQIPDVIMIGEIRDRETADTAIRAGASGHLVFGTLHAPSAPAAINELLSYIPDDMRVSRANTLSQSLLAVIGLALIPSLDAQRYVLASEILANLRSDKSVIDAIASEDTQTLFEYMRKGGDNFSRTLNTSLKDLVARKVIASRDALNVTYSTRELAAELRVMASRGAA